MKKSMLPSREALRKHAQIIPEINPSEVIAMLQVMQAAAEIQHAIIDVLEKDYQLSEGKLCVMILLHQQPEGLAPSALAEHAGVTRATISAMLRRMTRDGLVYSVSDEEDGRAKKICLTSIGRKFMDDILPAHYLRITKLMGKLSEQEQEELIHLLKKIVHE
jgi:DNA-binding MarR family transcriptional regulator